MQRLAGLLTMPTPQPTTSVHAHILRIMEARIKHQKMRRAKYYDIIIPEILIGYARYNRQEMMSYVVSELQSRGYKIEPNSRNKYAFRVSFVADLLKPNIPPPSQRPVQSQEPTYAIPHAQLHLSPRPGQTIRDLTHSSVRLPMPRHVIPPSIARQVATIEPPSIRTSTPLPTVVRKSITTQPIRTPAIVRKPVTIMNEAHDPKPLSIPVKPTPEVVNPPPKKKGKKKPTYVVSLI